MTPTDVAPDMQAKTKLHVLYFRPDETRCEEILVPKQSYLARRGSNAIPLSEYAASSLRILGGVVCEWEVYG